MHSKLAGHLPLSEMISRLIDDSRSKIAAAEGGDEKGEGKKEEKKVKKLVAYEKKEHGHVPSEKEEEAEKKASVLDFADPDEVEKLASALETVGDQLTKEADKAELGGESRQGGEVLADMSPVSGTQPYKKDSSKGKNVPMSTGLQAGDGGGPAKTQVPNDHDRAPGAGKAYPAKGVMKTSAAEGVVAKLQAALEKKAEFPPKKEEKAEAKGKEEKGEKKEEKGEKKEGEEKKASAPVDYILSKLAEGEAERKMGGETLDSKSGDGPKPPSQPGRQLISSNQAVVNAKKVQAKEPQKKLLSQVLTEPALSKAHDSKVHENLRNASKGGVKIAAARALLQKIAEEGCTCDGKGECKNCKMKKAMEKKALGGMPAVGGSMPSNPPPAPMM